MRYQDTMQIALLCWTVTQKPQKYIWKSSDTNECVLDFILEKEMVS